MMDEGYIKFETHWTKTDPLPEAASAELNSWRQRLYELGLIGAYPDGIGFGNISQRHGQEGQFLISGSATGNLPVLGPEHYALVTKVLPAENRLWCAGPLIASSESMSHAAVYQECPWVEGVIHVHHEGLWQRLLHQVPTTDRSAPYGSPEMAASIVRLLRETDLKMRRIFVMEGHREGIFAFGASLEEAFATLMEYYQS
jgi:L-ribulose-5-phosphate 4-epimerase